jgi:hypothetical protein
MSGRLPDFLGSTPEAPMFPQGPVPIFVMEWPWLRPLSAILSFSRWTIDDVVSSRRAAFEVRLLWKVYKLGQRLAAERERRLEQRELHWFRHQGCPVPCPDCGRVDACRCAH